MPPSEDKTNFPSQSRGNGARRARPWLCALAALALAMAALLWYGTTRQFSSWLRGQVVARLEQATGGRVELASFAWKPTRLEFELKDLTIHGLEASGQIPYLHVDRLHGRVRLASLAGGIKLASLALERPVFHLIVNADGSTNQPVPRQPGRTGAPAGRFFELGVERVEMHGGSLMVNDRVLPLDLTAEQVELAMSAAEAGQRYDGELRCGSARVKTDGLPEVDVEGRAEFSLWANRAQVRQLALRSGASELRAAGELRDFAHSEITATYEATLEVARFSGALGLGELRGGMFTVKGEGRWNEREFAGAGKVALREAQWVNRTFNIAAFTVGAEYALTPEKITLAHIFGSIFGGVAVGELEIGGWRRSLGLKRPRAGGEAAGDLHLRGERLLVGRIAEALTDRDLPLDRARLAGSGAATVSTRWRGTVDDAVTYITLDTEQAQHPAAGELPAAAMMRATFRSRSKQLEIGDLRVRTQASEFHLAGTLSSGSGKLNLLLDTRKLEELKPLVAAVVPGEWPFEVRGRTVFQGTVSGRMRAPVVTGRVQVKDFDSLVSLSRLSIGAQVERAGERAAARGQRLRWDALEARFEYSPTRLAITSATLERGQSRLNLELSAQLRQGHWAEDLPLQVTMDVRNGSATELIALAGDNYPVSGTVNARWQIEGTSADPRGSGTIALTRATLWGEPFERVTGRMALGGHEVQFTDVEAAHSGAALRGGGTYHLATTAFRFEVRARDLNLASVARLQRPGLNWNGLVSLTATGAGTVEAPSFNLEATATRLAANGERIGDLTVSAVTKGDRMTISAHSPLPNPALAVEGTLRLRQDYPADIKMSANRLTLDPLLRLFLKEKAEAHFTATGVLLVRGPLRHPEALHAEADLDELAGEIEHVALRNDGALRVTLDEGKVKLERLALAGIDTNLTARGTVGLGKPLTLDVTARGRMNLKLLQGFERNLSSYGNCTVNVQMNGTSARPLLSGRLELANAGIAYADLPNGLSDMRGRLVFNQDRLQVERLTAHTGGGTLDIGGFVSYAQGLVFNLTATGKDLRLRYPPGVSTVADANLALTGSAQSALLAGTVMITRFGVNPQFDFGPYLARARESVAAVAPDSTASRLRLDVQIASRPELQVETSLGRVSGDIDLKLRGTVARPAVLGRVSIVEGNVSIYGTQYRIQRGDITFTSPVGIEPVLDIQASASVRSYDITLGFHGPINKLSTTYRSDPPLSTADIVSLLAFGRTREETASTSTNQSLPETASYAILNQALTAAVTSRMQKIFGVSRIKIDPQMQNPAGLEYNGAGPTVTIEQQVANKLTVTYVSNLSRSNYQTIQAEYNVNRNVSIVAVRDWNGILSFDIRVRQRRR